MESIIKIGIIGDYDGRPSHRATNEAIQHSAAKLQIACESTWLPTVSLEAETNHKLSDFDGLWCAPGSPYKSMAGAINAIQYARESYIPFIGTCGGFQHAVIEIAKNVLHIESVQDAGFDPYQPNGIITPLSCSLVGQTKHIVLNKASKICTIYGTAEIEEKYNCSFGLNKDFQAQLNSSGFKVSGIDDQEDVRILDLEQNQFFIATLFQPQLSSTYEHPHPLVTKFLSSAMDFRKSRTIENNILKGKHSKVDNSDILCYTNMHLIGGFHMNLLHSLTTRRRR